MARKVLSGTMPCFLVAAVFVLMIAGQVVGDTFAQIEVFDSIGQFTQLEIGSYWHSTGTRYTWYEYPSYLEEPGQPYIWQTPQGPSPDWATINFNVLTDGVVILAATNRGWPPSTTHPEPWTSKEDFLADGWVQLEGNMVVYDNEVGMPSDSGVGVYDPPFFFEIYSRDCVAGETFSYRNETYHPPRPIIYPNVNIIPAPGSVVGLLSMIGTVGVIGIWKRWRKR